MAGFRPSLRKAVESLFHQPDYTPLRQHEIAARLGLKDKQRRDLRRVLRDLEQDGLAVRLRKNRWGAPRADSRVRGILRAHERGFGFVVPFTSSLEDVFVPGKYMGTALDGDTVEVSVVERPPPRRRGKQREPRDTSFRREGRIETIVKRAHETLPGLLMRTPYYWYVIPDNPRIREDVRVDSCAEGVDWPPEQHTVVVRLHPWKDDSHPLFGTIVEDLGPADAPGTDILSVMRSHHLSSEFEPELVEDAGAEKPTDIDLEAEDRRDLRPWMIFTIDPEDAKDFDDAISLRHRDDGTWLLGIHIADVAHYVRPGTRIDREAFQRATSTYLVDRVLPMLPGILTTDTCSLRPNEDRRTHSVLVTLRDDGEVVDVETCPSVIHSSARLNYQQVQTFFDGGEDHRVPGPVASVLREMRRLARTVRRRRMEEDQSIDFHLAEIKCHLDDQGNPVRISKRLPSESNQLIEEFMLLANRCVARIISEKQVESIYRVHPPPGPDNWEQMAQDLMALGMPAAPGSREEINSIAHRAVNQPNAYAVNLAILRNMRRAIYQPHRDEHFGLGFSHYTHFTSPIRRYPDLLVHRVLRAIETGSHGPYSREELEEMAVHCSEMEQNAEEAEEESVEIKRLEYYDNRLQAGETGPYEAIIVGIKSKGLLVELTESLLKGLIPFGQLTDDFYEADPDRGRAVGKRSGREWHMGQALQVDLARIDLARRQADFYLREGRPERRKKSGKKKKGKGRKKRRKGRR